MIQKKPIPGQQLKVLSPGWSVYNAEVTEVGDMDGEWPWRGLTFWFSVIIKDYPSDNPERKTRELKVRSSSHHFEPNPFSNINWPANHFANLFFFESEENVLKHKLDVYKVELERHASQAKIYSEKVEQAQKNLENHINTQL